MNSFQRTFAATGALLSLGIFACDQSKAELDQTKSQLQAVTTERDALKTQVSALRSHCSGRLAPLDRRSQDGSSAHLTREGGEGG
jgi:hypothetical protein